MKTLLNIIFVLILVQITGCAGLQNVGCSYNVHYEPDRIKYNLPSGCLTMEQYHDYRWQKELAERKRQKLAEQKMRQIGMKSLRKYHTLKAEQDLRDYQELQQIEDEGRQNVLAILQVMRKAMEERTEIVSVTKINGTQRNLEITSDGMGNINIVEMR